MHIVYYSFTGKVAAFAKKTGMRSIEITPTLKMESDYILITSTVGFGEIPDPVKNFLLHNHGNMVGVSASGNRNWDKFSKGMFGRAGDLIAQKYGVPLLSKFELSGTTTDVKNFLDEVDKLELKPCRA